jgi:hypothetical protein
VNEMLPIVFVVAVAVVVFGLLAVGGILVARDTYRRKGRWGINTKSARCLQCDTPAPVVRVPKNLNQTLWGGWTCAECGYELDKWGEPVDKQPFLAKWSAQIDDSPSPNGERQKKPTTDITRRDEYRD